MIEMMFTSQALENHDELYNWSFLQGIVKNFKKFAEPWSITDMA